MKKFIFICSLMIASLQGNEYSFPDPYPEVYESIKVLPYYMHGWHKHEREVTQVFAENDIQTVIEVGVWLGNWTNYVATLLPEDGKVFAVDHWRGSPEHYNQGSLEATLLPTLFQQFLSNVIHNHLESKIIPVRMGSLKAARKFKKMEIKGDLIYIDAGHDFQSVYNDIKAWYPNLSEKGLICGDDWNLGGVAQAVRTYAEENNLLYKFQGEFWWLEKR